ncbi:DUF3488 and transglutaminase-like domain-containing protein [Kangiella sp. TOML190]|uniref:transglutaminase family protein n=1 Tax=Kangiella sp. TOML190 TaxID=2931351 RepID=UPI00204173DB|nr:DUF3488 and transglutaminase-like domain-containing protein [Kangiella sp. TOML190]
MQSKELNIFRAGIIPLLILVQLIVLLPLWFEIPLWVTLLSIALLGMKYLSYRFDFRYPNWLILALVIGAFVGVYAYFKTISGRDAGVSLICLMYCFKLLESKSYRDATLVLFISFFVMVMAFLFNQSIAMGLYLLIAMAAILSAIVALNSLQGISGIRNLGRISGTALLQALPIMLVLFLLFPRLPGPLWAMPDSSQAGTGISDSMSPGDIGALTTFDDPAFRAKFKGQAPSATDMYWRAMVFSDYDGFTWREGPRAPTRTNRLPPFEPSYEYQVQMEPNKSRWLFGLEQLASSPKGTFLFNDLTWRRPQKIINQFSYNAQAVKYDYQGVELESFKRRINLQLPDDGNLRTRQWAQTLFQQANGTQDFINRVLNHINQRQYYYTLTPEVLEEEVVDGFWFGTQEGFCEHYAGAFVFIMRAAGIPTRVVTGYQGGEYNPYGDYYLIRQSDAHAWTEVWVENQGWLRVDPTAAIDPSRVEADLRSRANRRDSWFEDKMIGFDLPQGFLAKLQMRWDAIKSFWDDTLMGYGQDQQNDWLSKLGIKADQWRYLGYGLVATLILSGLIFGLWLLRKSARRDVIEKYYERLKQELVKSGTEIPSHYGPMAILDRLKGNHPELHAKFATPIKYYIKIRYQSEQADQVDEDWIRRFKTQVKKL